MPALGFSSRPVALVQPQLEAGRRMRVGPILRVESQCRSRWCWAAVAQSVATHFGHARFPRQQELAFQVLTTVYQKNIDRDEAVRGACGPKETGPSDIAIDQIPLEEAGVRSVPVGASLSETALQEELAQGRPVCAIVNWRSTIGSHAIAIVGSFADANGVVRYIPGDPQVPDVPAHTYEQLVNAYNSEGRLANAWLVLP
jgi:hypothetical protein